MIARKAPFFAGLLFALLSTPAIAEDDCLIAYEQDERFFCPEMGRPLSHRDFVEKVLEFFIDKVPEDYAYDSVDEALRRMERQVENTEKTIDDLAYVCRDPIDGRVLRQSNWFDRWFWGNQVVDVVVFFPSRNSGDPLFTMRTTVDKCGYDYDYASGYNNRLKTR